MLQWKGLFLVLVAVVTSGCSTGVAKTTTNHKKKPAATASASPSVAHPLAPPVEATKEQAAESASSGASHEGSNNYRFALPFAWERSTDEPLARTREFVKESLRDNLDYMKHGPKFFESFAKAQTPRATVVTCSDSRVQNAAWNLTPENDEFTIRNVGNQIQTSEGSVEYGVEHLGTPVLLIVGHTGCGAVKAAMGDKSKLSPPLRKEIETINLPKELLGQGTDSAWTQAVLAHLNAQVKLGLSHFGQYVAEGRLTVIGAVYDFRNDLGHGAGRLTVVNVNGHGEKDRLEAFVSAVTGNKKGAMPEPPTPSHSPGSAVDASRSIEQIAKSIESIPALQLDQPATETGKGVPH